MKTLPIFVVVLAVLLTTVAGPAEAAPSPFEGKGKVAPNNKIDKLVFARWKQEGIEPARPSSDAVFVRRVYLDVIGTLPVREEAREFLQDKDPKKRSKLIDQLLERDEFADYWAIKWGDLLRVKSEFPINLWPNAVQAYHRWIHTALKNNMPYDRFARELLTSSGSNFRVPQVNFYRAVQGSEPPTLAKAVALTFMGDRMGSWPKTQQEGLTRCFSRVGYKGTAEWKEEIVYFDSTKKVATSALMPDGTTLRLRPDQDPREAFADWLVKADNPWFARNIVNRAWYWLQGRGIIHEPDDIRPNNPPSHEKLLKLLEAELVKSNYDLQHIYRLILNSSTYQLSSVPRSEHPQAEALFAYYPLRRLDAEVLIDALCQITGTTEEYSSRIPEPFTFIPKEHRSITLPDGSITSSFLEMFGRPPRDTGMESERNNEATAAQRLHMLNSSHVRKKIEQGPGMRGLKAMSRRNPKRAINELYLAVLSRYPTNEELAIAQEYAKAHKSRRSPALVDIAWALVNSPEFLYRH